MLPVAVVVFLIAPAVAEVDASHEGHVRVGPCRMSDDHQLLVVGAAESHALVEKDLAAGCVHLYSKMAVLPGAESKPVEV
jgi:hypothetical protein